MEPSVSSREVERIEDGAITAAALRARREANVQGMSRRTLLRRSLGFGVALWITEVWVSQADHQASLKLPSVQAAIAKGRPLIASFGDRVETSPIGGVGLAK